MLGGIGAEPFSWGSERRHLILCLHHRDGFVHFAPVLFDALAEATRESVSTRSLPRMSTLSIDLAVAHQK